MGMDISDQISPVKSPYKSKPRTLYIGEGYKKPSVVNISAQSVSEQTRAKQQEQERREINKALTA
jgi:hypothetical protein